MWMASWCSPSPRRTDRGGGFRCTQGLSLIARRKQQVAERLAAGDQWTDTKMVFGTELGTMVDARNLLRTVELAAAKAKIENVGAHTMRHSAAVAWLARACTSRPTAR